MKRVALIIALVAISVSAALGILALVGGDFGDTQGRVLATSMLVTASAVVALASAVAIEAGRLGPLPMIGVTASILGFGMMVVGVWAEPEIEGFWKTAGTFIIAAVAIGYAGVMGSARLPVRQRWVLGVAELLAGLAAMLIIGAMWIEVDSEVYWRASGIVFVLLAAATVAVPVLHRMADLPTAREEALPDVEHCPFCGTDMKETTGHATLCHTCGERFAVVVK